MIEDVWEGLSRTLRASAPYGALRQGLGEAVRLPVPAAAWVTGLLRQDLGRQLLALVPREADALGWSEASRLFAGEVGRGRTVYFPAPSLSPYQETEVSLLIRAQEAVSLDLILRGEAHTVVATPRALFRHLPSPEAFARGVLELEPEQDLPLDRLLDHLLRYGYHRTDLVSEVGEVAVRGGIFDVFPPGAEAPYRLELFGDTLESIRLFDPASQRSEERLDRVRVLPLSLFPRGADDAQLLAELLAEELGRKAGMVVDERLEALRERGGFPGWESFLPLLAVKTLSLCEVLRDPLIVALDPPALAQEARHHAQVLESDFEARHLGGRLVLAPERMEHPLATVEASLARAEVSVGDLSSLEAPAADAGREVDFAGSMTDLFQGQLPRFASEVDACRSRGERVVLVASPGHRRRTEELLEGREIALGAGGVEIVEGELSRGFRLPSARVVVFSEPQLLPRAKPQRRVPRARYGPFLSSLRDLRVGDFVVHADHGIGQFVALRSVGGDGGGPSGLPPSLAGLQEDEGGAVEVMEIVYAGARSLLLPLTRLDLVQKFSGIEGVSPRLDQLGGSSWNRTKARVKKSMRDMTGELLKLYAQRQMARAPAMEADSDLMRQFEAAFAYEETPDQLEAVAAIKEDLARERPMDRLLCGDVGYGKTEVAMRAAFKAVDSGFQVAVLAPTTILADQHLDTFRSRFQGFPVSLEMISRFRSPAEVKDVTKRLSEGKVDILIGTHRLLSKDISFPRLGLLIVDEEQRFGVAQKERLKQLKRDIHVLAMSATPVPRTLQMSLAGVRDMSVIETPPKDRMAVETTILPFNPQLIREAVEFELERGGQVYYVYNRVESIERMLSFLREAIPGARVTVGHGQLEEKELSRRMHAFTAGEFDILLATTIIENGIDIPNVNTMIVHRADRFGLAQLYQLRGRVGRSNQLAYCYLLVPEDRILSEVARKRLAALREFSDLGAGFRIAARDLEIRGAGNLLGAEQSGHIGAVGIETYLKMLEETVRELQGEEVPEAPSAAIDLPVPMSIPQSYIEDANLRMEVYRKAVAGDSGEEEILAELEDRFGTPPKEVHTLLEVAAVKRLAETLRVQSVSGQKRRLVLRLRKDAKVDVERLIALVSARQGASFSPSGVLVLEGVAAGGLLTEARQVLEELAR